MQSLFACVCILAIPAPIGMRAVCARHVRQVVLSSSLLVTELLHSIVSGKFCSACSESDLKVRLQLHFTLIMAAMKAMKAMKAKAMKKAMKAKAAAPAPAMKAMKK